MPRPAVPDAQWLWENEPCRAACPVHTDAGAYVTAIAEGRFRDAYLIARAPNPFASICGRVCAAPCEAACRRGTVDAPIAIRALKRFVTEQFGVESFAANTIWHEAHGPVPPATLGSVGIVGGGPAGLSAAYELRLAGHPVTIYEAADRLGGMMVLGIPEYRLARELINREIEAVIELGIDVELSFRVGRDATIDELLARHESLFLSVGTGRGRDLDLPGRELDGVLSAVEFLLNVNQGFRVDLGKRVVVVGGGNVAFDAARSALRAAGRRSAERGRPGLGRRNERRRPPRNDHHPRRRPRRRARRRHRRHRHRARVARGDPRRPGGDRRGGQRGHHDPVPQGTAPLRRRGGRVTGLETIDVESVFDADHRFNPTFLPGTEAVLEADTIILAVGQTADLDVLGSVELERERGGIKVDPDTLRTSHPASGPEATSPTDPGT